MSQDDTLLRSKEEMIEDAASKSPEEAAFIRTMIDARERFDELVDPIITGMIADSQHDNTAPMDDNAMAVAEGIKQALTAHLGKLIAVVGLGTKGEVEGENALSQMTTQALHAVMANVRMTANHLAEMKANRENGNG